MKNVEGQCRSVIQSYEGTCSQARMKPLNKLSRDSLRAEIKTGTSEMKASYRQTAAVCGPCCGPRLRLAVIKSAEIADPELAKHGLINAELYCPPAYQRHETYRRLHSKASRITKAGGKYSVPLIVSRQLPRNAPTDGDFYAMKLPC